MRTDCDMYSVPVQVICGYYENLAVF